MKKSIWLRIIAIQALIAMLGSLYFGFYGDPVLNFSEGAFFSLGGFEPCDLCRYARICMYPISLIAILGLIFKDKGVFKYTLALAIIGALIGLYHNYFMLMNFASPLCKPGNPCMIPYLDYLGFITIPLLALTGFAVIIVASIIGMKKNK